MIKNVLEKILKGEDIEEETGVSNIILKEIFSKSLQTTLFSLSITRESIIVKDAPFFSNILIEWFPGDKKVFQLSKNPAIWGIYDNCAKPNDGKSREWISLEDLISLSQVVSSLFSKFFLLGVRKYKQTLDVNRYVENIGHVIRGFVIKVVKNDLVLLEVDREKRMSGILLKRYQSPVDRYEVGKYFWVLLKDVEKEKLILDRSSSEFVQKLMESQIESLKNNRISIKKIIRLTGIRTKVIVGWQSNSNDTIAVHAVSEVVGVAGNNLLGITQEINEQIDVLPWYEDVEKMAKNILSPIKVQKVSFLSSEHIVLNVSPNDVISAIGKNGTNVKMIAMLMNKKITIASA